MRGDERPVRVHHLDADVLAQRARVEIANQRLRTEIADDLVAIPDENEDGCLARDPRQILLWVLSGCGKDREKRARRKRGACRTSRPIHDESPAARIADHRNQWVSQCLHAGSYRVDDVRHGVVVAGHELVAGIEHGVPAGREMAEPRAVVLRRVLERAAVPVDEDDDASRRTVRGPEHPDLVRALSVWPFPASCTRAATRDREKDEQNGRHGFRWTRHPR